MAAEAQTPRAPARVAPELDCPWSQQVPCRRGDAPTRSGRRVSARPGVPFPARLPLLRAQAGAGCPSFEFAPRTCAERRRPPLHRPRWAGICTHGGAGAVEDGLRVEDGEEFPQQSRRTRAARRRTGFLFRGRGPPRCFLGWGGRTAGRRPQQNCWHRMVPGARRSDQALQPWTLSSRNGHKNTLDPSTAHGSMRGIVGRA
jgi:hypothetical protein